METINLNNDPQSLHQNAEEPNGQTDVNNVDPLKEKNKKKHHSALVAAAAGRSAVQHAHTHIITNRPGDFAHSGTNIVYED